MTVGNFEYVENFKYTKKMIECCNKKNIIKRRFGEKKLKN